MPARGVGRSARCSAHRLLCLASRRRPPKTATATITPRRERSPAPRARRRCRTARRARTEGSVRTGAAFLQCKWTRRRRPRHCRRPRRALGGQRSAAARASTPPPIRATAGVAASVARLGSRVRRERVTVHRFALPMQPAAWSPAERAAAVPSSTISLESSPTRAPVGYAPGTVQLRSNARGRGAKPAARSARRVTRVRERVCSRGTTRYYHRRLRRHRSARAAILSAEPVPLTV